MAVIGKEGLRAVAQRTVDVECPELGGAIRVRRLSAMESAQIAKLAQSATDGSDLLLTIEMLAEMVAMGWVDENGLQVVTNDAGRKVLTEWPMDLLQRVADAVGDISGMGKDAAKEAEKNL